MSTQNEVPCGVRDSATAAKYAGLPIAARLFAALVCAASATAQDQAHDGDQAAATVKDRFLALDTDQNGTLSEAEFLPQDADPGSRARDFKLFDTDANGALSPDEFQCIPWAASLAERGVPALPDPLMVLVADGMEAVNSAWSAADTNGDGAVSQREFESSAISRSVPGLAQTNWNDWNRNDALTQEECREVLEVAYGARRPQGEPVRFPSGIVVNWMLWKHFDDDHDDRISAREFEQRGFGDPVQRPQTFKQLDMNGDGVLTFAEWSDLSQPAVMPARRHDPIADFLRLDADFDGFVSPQELSDGMPSWHSDVTRHVFPGFDADGDDRLSLIEYRMTPLANWVEFWQYPRTDADHDGRLGPAEFRWGASTQGSLAALIDAYFQLYDVNHDGSLDLDEFAFNTTRRDPKREFQARDADSNEFLSTEEFAKFAPAGASTASRDFRILDVNGDGQLSYDEFRCWPSAGPLELRGPYPDPVMDLVVQGVAEIEPILREADNNQDGAVSQEEFRQPGMARRVRGLELSSWSDWDRNGDGSLTQNECRNVFEIAHGVRRPQGEPVRFPSGVVVNWMLWKHFDDNQDDHISSREFAERGFGDPAERPRTFEQMDRNGDGVVTFAEWSDLTRPDVMVGRLHDPIADFLRLDADFNGFVTPEELHKGMPDWHLELTQHIFPGFDGDGDGRLSLSEYRTSPLANWVEFWHITRSDHDADGYLSRSEFSWPTKDPISLARLVQHYFGRLDVDGDGRLDLDEFFFNLNAAKAPRSIVFRWKDKDRDGRLTFEEASSGIQPPGGDKNDMGYQTMVAQSEEAFHKADRNADGVLTLDEFESDDAVTAVAPSGRMTTDNLSSTLVRHGDDESSPNWRFRGIIALNVLLVLGVAVYLFRAK